MSSRVRLNVGGEIFETSLSTLERAGRDSVLGALLDPAWRQLEEQDTPPVSRVPSYEASLSACHGRQWMSAPSSPMLKGSLAPLHQTLSTGAGVPVPSTGSRCCSSPCLQGMQELSLRTPLDPLHEDFSIRNASGEETPPSCLHCQLSTELSNTTASVLDSSNSAGTSSSSSCNHSNCSSSRCSGARRELDMSTPSTGCFSFSTPSKGCPPPHSPPVDGPLRVSLGQCSKSHPTAPQHSTPSRTTSPALAPVPSSPSAASAARLPKPIPEIFLDRDPAVFKVLLNLLRTGNLDLSSGVSLQSVILDADYLGLLDSVKGALLPPPLDANEMEKVNTLSPNVGPTEACTAMCGNVDGSLTVAHGSRITAYDWSLDRVSTIFSELPQVDTIAHLSETRIVVAGAKACDALPVYDLRSSSSRESKVGCIAVSGASHPCFRSIVASDRFLFVASLRKTLGAEWGVGKAVGVVDRETLQTVGDPGAAPLTTRRLSGPDKLQWIDSRGLLLVAKRYSLWPGGVHEGASYVRLWDPRCNQVIWDWREYEEPAANSVPADRWYALSDAVVCEDLDLLFKASPTSSDALSSRLSAVDLRALSSTSTSGTAVTVTNPVTTFSSGPVTASPPAGPMPAAGGPLGTATGAGTGGTPVSPRSAAALPDHPVAAGLEGWSTLQWQTSSMEGLRIGAATRDPRYDNQVLRLVTVPGTSQVICNRQPTLEVWSPVAQFSGDDRAPKRSTLERGPIDPFMFRRTYGDSKEEYNRKRMNCTSMTSWVYDMAIGGDHRLFVVREDNRQGLVDYGSIEVWETRQRGRLRNLGFS